MLVKHLRCIVLNFGVSMSSNIKGKLKFSKIYSFKCRKRSKEVNSRIGGPGFSRVVHCNEPEGLGLKQSSIRGYVSNYVRTTKYTVASFFPKSLFEQFRRVANFYFLVTGILSFTPVAPYSADTAIVPLFLVIGATMVKDGFEDWKRNQQDIEVNNRKVNVHRGSGSFKQTEWKNLKVGDIVKVEKDEYFPADLLLLSSSYEDSVCYVETMNLDGETNLKLKQALEVTSSLREEDFKDFRAVVKCEDPNANLYSFVGCMEENSQRYSLSLRQLLLRDSKIRNTDYILGAVIFTGHDTKVIQNSTKPPSKRSKIEKKTDKIVYFLFGTLFLMAFVGSVYFGVVTKADGHRRWYLQLDSANALYDSQRAPAAAIYHFLTALLLYSFLIPISLYVSIEIVKILQSIFINQDVHMYYEETDRSALPRTSNLNEELGQVYTILSDKTGTLTCNSMEFIKCSVAGIAYGSVATEPFASSAKPSLKGFSFDDSRIMHGNWINETHWEIIQKFFRLLAICHTAIPEADENTGKVTYEAESPDEAAFVIAAREIGFEFFQRTQASVSVKELDPTLGEHVKRSYTLLNVLEFSSSRKRMSVIVKDEGEKLLLLSKGADSVMFERLANNGSEFEEQTREHVNEYADAGFRTLILAYRELDEEEYKIFNEKISQANNSMSADRDAFIDEAIDDIEKNLILLGATAVEDRLQHGVPECIDKLTQAGIKIWVLTGDKMETAINVGYSCSLLRQGMKQIIITLDNPDIIAVEKTRVKDAISMASKQSVIRQITEARNQVIKSSSDAFGLVIDGKSLIYAFEDEAKKVFLQLATSCASVICCRTSPKQKALVTRVVKEATHKTTLAIGDGANDVGMLQEADIGIGISGVEGMQAVMSSDIAIAQFRFLERLLLVHGHWCYRRISSMICYFFYKNITFGFTLFMYEAYTSFSGQPAYNDWFLSLYNVFFTSLPVIAMGVFDQDVSASLCLKFPLLYQEGVQNVLFSSTRILGWMLNGLCGAAIIFIFCMNALTPQGFNRAGELADSQIFGAMMYTCAVCVVNFQMALAISYFTMIQHIFIWGGIALWYLFLLVYGALSPGISTTGYMVLVESLAPDPSFYIVTVLVVITSLVPYFLYKALRMRLFPMYHGMIQWMIHDGRTDDPEYCNLVRQRSIRPSTVGSTARALARTRL